jgi:hypothetical protein
VNIIQKAIASLFSGDKEKAYKTVIVDRATKPKRFGRRHRPYTKPPMLGESKKRRQMAAKSRKINRERER